MKIIFAPLAALLVLLAAGVVVFHVFFTAGRKGSDQIVYGLYAWARWWQALAVAADRALKAFREQRRDIVIAPESLEVEL